MHRRRSLLLGIMGAVLALTGVAPASAGNPPSSPGGPVWRWDEITPAAPWAGRAGLQAVELGTSFYLMGGRTPVGFAPGVPPGASQLWSDVWRSDDRGRTWQQVLASGGTDHWAPRAYFQAVRLAGAMYVLGGQDFTLIPNPGCAAFPPGVPCPLPDVPNSTFFNDVWRSTDGVTWTRMTEHAPWQGRAGLSAVVKNGAIYVFGGSVNDDSAVVGGAPPRIYFNDVWRSTDGANWTRMTADAGWAPRAGAAAVVQHGWIYLLGGEDGFVCNEQTPRCPPYYNDVWRSRNGRTWQQVTPAAGWSPRPGHQCAVAASDIVCFGGFGLDGNPVDVWASPNGKRWRQLPGAPWNAASGEEVKYDFDAISTIEVRNGRPTPAIYTFGGDRETFDFGDPLNPTRIDNDVWRYAPAARR